MAGKWAKPHGHWEWVSDELGTAFDPAIFLTRPKADTGDHWGPWVYNAEQRLLTYRDGRDEYEIPLDRIDSATSFVEWLAQLEEKGWVPESGLGHFVHAIRDLVGLRKLAHPSDK